MFDGVRPFDWLMLIVKAAVLLLIIYEVGVTINGQIQARKRGKVAAKLADFMFEGQTLAQTTPNRQLHQSAHYYDMFTQWARGVENWRIDVAQHLSGLSPRAANAFLLITSSEANASNQVHLLDGGSFQLSGYERDIHQAHLAHIATLQHIIEKPEAYF
jgi:hypothetical protein